MRGKPSIADVDIHNLILSLRACVNATSCSLCPHNGECDMIIKDSLEAIELLLDEKQILNKQLQPFKERQCFTCAFYIVGSDHMPCYVCDDCNRYEWLGNKEMNI